MGEISTKAVIIITLMMIGLLLLVLQENTELEPISKPFLKETFENFLQSDSYLTQTLRSTQDQDLILDKHEIQSYTATTERAREYDKANLSVMYEYPSFSNHVETLNPQKTFLLRSLRERMLERGETSEFDGDESDSGDPEPCPDSTLYRFNNGSCLPDCPSDYFIARTRPHLMCVSCHSTCGTCSVIPSNCTSCLDSSYYLYPNHTCLTQCSTDIFEIVLDFGNQKSCIAKQVLAEGDKQIVKVIHTLNEAGSKVLAVSVVYGQMLNHATSSNAAKLLMINLVQFIRYLNINYPTKLVMVFNNEIDTLINFNFIPSAPDWVQSRISQYTAPERFSRYGVSGLFIVNFWSETLTTFAILLGALLLTLLRKIKFKWLLIDKFLSFLQDVLIWNFIFTFFLSNLGDLIVSSIIEIKGLTLDGGFAIASFVFNILFCTVYLAMQMFIIIMLYSVRRKQHMQSFEDKAKRYPTIRILFEGVKTKYFIQEMLLSVTSLKTIMSAIVIAAFDAPILQSIILIILSVAMIVYLAKFRPIAPSVRNYELIIYEILVLIATIVCLVMSCRSSTEQFEDGGASDTIIVVNFCLIGLLLFFQLAEWIIFIRRRIQLFKRNRKSTKICPQTTTDTAQGEDKTPTKIPKASSVKGAIQTFLNRFKRKRIFPQVLVHQQLTTPKSEYDKQQGFEGQQTNESFMKASLLVLKRFASDPSKSELDKNMDFILTANASIEPYTCGPFSRGSSVGRFSSDEL